MHAVLLGSIFMDFLVPVHESGLATAGITGVGDLRYQLSPEWYERIVEHVESADAGPVEVNAMEEEEEKSAAELREEERQRRERDVRFVAGPLNRDQRANRSVRHTVFDFSRAAHVGLTGSSEACY